MSFSQYPKYKDSGVEWLADVPEHWPIRRLGYHFIERREKVNDVDFPALSVTKRGVVPQLETAAKTDDNDNRKRVAIGDFVINSRSDRNGSAGISRLDGSVSLINTVLRPRDGAHGPFVHHLLRSQRFQEEFYRFGKGIVADLWSTNYSEMRNISVAIPCEREQIVVAAFLDGETAKIDALITEHQRLMELLREKRQSLISTAVTKGLNPNARMKPSGVEWLGSVPEHWKVLAVRRCVREHRQGYYSAESYADAGVKLLRITDLRDHGSVDLSDCPLVEDRDELAPFLLQPSDFVFARTGGAGTFGVIDGIEERAVYASYLIRFRFTSNATASFLRYFFLSSQFQGGLQQNIHGGVNQNLHAEDIKNQYIALPPKQEQLEIAVALRERTVATDRLLRDATHAVALLQERRAALISAAVTGKIDVRAYDSAKGSEAA